MRIPRSRGSVSFMQFEIFITQVEIFGGALQELDAIEVMVFVGKLRDSREFGPSLEHFV